MEIRYYNGKKLDCIKGFSEKEKDNFIFWIEFEKKVGNTVSRISENVYKVLYK